MLTKEEYKRIAIRIFDGIREADSEFLGECTCDGVSGCSQCPLNKLGCNCDCFETRDGLDKLFASFKSLEYLEKWAKEHPATTYEDKYEETFGRKPITQYGQYFCPKITVAGYRCPHDGTEILISDARCKECKEKFWKSEYVPPKRN